MCPETMHVLCIPSQIYIHQSVTAILIFLLWAMFRVVSRRQLWWAIRVITTHHFDRQKYWLRVEYYFICSCYSILACSFQFVYSHRSISLIAGKDMWPHWQPHCGYVCVCIIYNILILHTYTASVYFFFVESAAAPQTYNRGRPTAAHLL